MGDAFLLPKTNFTLMFYLSVPDNSWISFNGYLSLFGESCTDAALMLQPFLNIVPPSEAQRCLRDETLPNCCWADALAWCGLSLQVEGLLTHWSSCSLLSFTVFLKPSFLCHQRMEMKRTPVAWISFGGLLSLHVTQQNSCGCLFHQLRDPLVQWWLSCFPIPDKGDLGRL